MPSWKIHRKWGKELGIPENIVDEVNMLIDFPEEWFKEKYPERYDRIVNGLEEVRLLDVLDKDPCIALFKASLAVNMLGHDVGRRRKWQRDLQLECAFKHYGDLGVKAALLHHALDYIWATANLFEKQEIMMRINQKLYEESFGNILSEILSFISAHWEEILQDVKKSPPQKKHPRKGGMGIKGIFIVDGIILTPAAAISKIYKEVKCGKSVYVEWQYNSYEIRRIISNESELDDLISEIKSRVRD